MRGKPIEIAELTAAAAEDQRDFDRRRHHFERLDRNSAGEEDRVDPGRLICLGPLNGLVKVGDRQRTGATGDNEVLSCRADSAAFILPVPSSTELKPSLS